MIPKKKNLKSVPLLFVGFLLGMSMHWLPIDKDFSPVTPTEWIPPKIANADHFPFPTTNPIIQRKGYTLAYDGRMRNAFWVYKKFTKNALHKEAIADRSQCDFKEDPLIPKHLRATNQDYHDSGFDRGHLCTAQDAAISQELLEETFYLSNVAPQVPQFNRGYWKKLENHVRTLTEEYGKLHVFIGPLYLGKKGIVKYKLLGKNEVAVPTHFFAVLFTEAEKKGLQSQSYIIPNQEIDSEIPLKKFLTNLEEVEHSSGMIFTSN